MAITRHGQWPQPPPGPPHELVTNAQQPGAEQTERNKSADHGEHDRPLRSRTRRARAGGSTIPSHRSDVSVPRRPPSIQWRSFLSYVPSVDGWRLREQPNQVATIDRVESSGGLTWSKHHLFTGPGDLDGLPCDHLREPGGNCLVVDFSLSGAHCPATARFPAAARTRSWTVRRVCRQERGWVGTSANGSPGEGNREFGHPRPKCSFRSYSPSEHLVASSSAEREEDRHRRRSAEHELNEPEQLQAGGIPFGQRGVGDVSRLSRNGVDRPADRDSPSPGSSGSITLTYRSSPNCSSSHPPKFPRRPVSHVGSDNSKPTTSTVKLSV